MKVSLPDIIGLSAALVLWVCALVYFVTHPQKRSTTDIDINNVMGWSIKSKSGEKKGLFNRFSVTKEFEHRENETGSPPDFSDSGEIVDIYVTKSGERKISQGTNSSKRINLDDCSVKRKPKKRSLNQALRSSQADLKGQSVEQDEELDGENVIPRHSSSVHI